MRSAMMLGVPLAILAATACSSLTTNQATQPEPEERRRPAALRIPRGHLPAPGQCRVWMPGEPPGHQRRPRSCAGIERTAPAGSWIVYRPSEDKKVVHVREVDQRRSGVVVRVQVYDAEEGTYIRKGNAARRASR